jgi:hypothetical protein
LRTVVSEVESYLNPFCAAKVRPGSVPFFFPPGRDAEQLLQKLERLGGAGQILGRHGAGKSTLLATLEQRLSDRKEDVERVLVTQDVRRLPGDLYGRIRGGRIGWLLIDGFEQLSRIARWRIKRACRRSATRLIVTAHASQGLPTLVEIVPEVSTICEVVRILSPTQAQWAEPDRVAALITAHGGNIREVLFELYDLYERRPQMVNYA